MPKRKHAVNDDFVKSLSDELRRRDLAHALKNVNDAVSRGRYDALKALNELVNVFFGSKWSRCLKYCDCVAQCVQDALEFSLQRSAHAKIRCHKAASLLCGVLMFIDESACVKDDFVMYGHDTLMSRLHKHLVCLEMIERSRLVRKYMGCFVDEHMLLVLSALQFALKKGDKRMVCLYVQYVLGLGKDEYNNDDDSERDEGVGGSSCACIKDDFGLFSDVKDSDKRDTCWLLWFLIILYNKSRSLKEKDVDVRRDYWLYVDELVAKNFIVFKAMYNKRDRDERVIVLIRLYMMIASGRPSKGVDEVNTRLDYDDVDSKVSEYLKTYEIPSGGLLMRPKDEKPPKASRQVRFKGKGNVVKARSETFDNQDGNERHEDNNDMVDNNDAITCIDDEHHDCREDVTYFDDGCDDYRVQYNDTHIVRRLNKNNDDVVHKRRNLKRKVVQGNKSKSKDESETCKPMDYLMCLTRKA